MAKSAKSKDSLNEKTAAVAAPAKKNRARKNKPSYARFINRVLKQVHPNTGISKKGMVVMDNLIEDMFERLASEAKELNSKKKKATMQVFDIQQAARLVLPGELSKHGISEGTKAYQNFQMATKK
mmetsp:Transcript_24049/g.33608  ORF Transcript_24049/g.33608 Transcript_24049/m.33608 type:complete len:125 (+) Transcript_24049:82-456(+)